MRAIQQLLNAYGASLKKTPEPNSLVRWELRARGVPEAVVTFIIPEWTPLRSVIERDLKPALKLLLKERRKYEGR